mgnify:CR=1 FL=1
MKKEKLIKALQGEDEYPKVYVAAHMNKDDLFYILADKKDLLNSLLEDKDIVTINAEESPMKMFIWIKGWK